MEFAVLGDPGDGPTLDLNHEAFAYAGKFVVSNTGKAVAREGDEVIAAAAFNEDRTDEDCAWIRYVTVREDRRGEGIGPRLLDHVAKYQSGRGKRVRIAVNNPFAYEAAYKAGFGYTGEETGLAELVLERPAETGAETYRDGMSAFEKRTDLTPDERRFVSSRGDSDPPERV
jgi:GNAT superfamily N-acetyltransferase